MFSDLFSILLFYVNTSFCLSVLCCFFYFYHIFYTFPYYLLLNIVLVSHLFHAFLLGFNHCAYCQHHHYMPSIYTNLHNVSVLFHISFYCPLLFFLLFSTLFPLLIIAYSLFSFFSTFLIPPVGLPHEAYFQFNFKFGIFYVNANFRFVFSCFFFSSASSSFPFFRFCSSCPSCPHIFHNFHLCSILNIYVTYFDIHKVFSYILNFIC